MSQDYYVYTHSKPNGDLFYVGKGGKSRVSRVSREHNQRHCRVVSKYGKENIIVRSMLCKSNDHACQLEIKLIAALRSGGADLCNVTAGGEGALGRTPSIETRARISQAVKLVAATPEWRAKASYAARNKPPVSIETRKKISIATLNQSSETREKQRVSRLGRVNSPETRAKRVASLLATWDFNRANGLVKEVSAETRNKLSVAAKGKKRTEEQCEAMRGKKRTPEQCQNISKALAGVKKTRTAEGEIARKANCAATMAKKVASGWVRKKPTPVSAETRAKQSLAGKGRKTSQAQKDKRKATMTKKKLEGIPDNSQSAEAIAKRVATRRANSRPKSLEERLRLDKRNATRAANKAKKLQITP